MILVDTSVWIDHLRKTDRYLQFLLDEGDILCHPMIVGEIAVGSFRQRTVILKRLLAIPSATVASHEEALEFITQHSLFGSGIGYIDAHLLAATRLTSGASFWTRDKSLHAAAEALSLDFGGAS